LRFLVDESAAFIDMKSSRLAKAAPNFGAGEKAITYHLTLT
jgi:hypothetical protein